MSIHRTHMIDRLNKKDCRHFWWASLGKKKVWCRRQCHTCYEVYIKKTAATFATKNCMTTKTNCILISYTSKQESTLPRLNIKRDLLSRQYFQILCLTKRVTTEQLLSLSFLNLKTRVNDVQTGTDCTRKNAYSTFPAIKSKILPCTYFDYSINIKK